MKQEVCINCGSHSFIYKNGAKYCEYCNTKYELSDDERRRTNTTVSLQSDIDILLEKCIADPAHAKKYANLILDIDPTNKEAKKYL